MADPFSIATGAVQVAGAGIQLAKTLYDYLECVKGAHKQIKAIAVEVRLTSSVLEHLGALLKGNDAEKLCSDAIVQDAGAAFEGCKGAFEEINDAFKVLIKPRGDGTKTVTAAAKWSWPFKKGKLETLQANLERLKTTLLLMLSVLGYAKDKVSRPLGSEVDSTIEKLQIQNLMKARADAIERYEQLLSDFSSLDTASSETDSVLIGKSALDGTGQGGSNSVYPSLNSQTINLHTVAPSTPNRIPHNGQDSLFVQLQTCASAVSHLSATLNAASFRWATTQEFETDGIADSFIKLCLAAEQLLGVDLANPVQISYQNEAATTIDLRAPIAEAVQLFRQKMPSAQSMNDEQIREAIVQRMRHQLAVSFSQTRQNMQHVPLPQTHAATDCQLQSGNGAYQTGNLSFSQAAERSQETIDVPQGYQQQYAQARNEQQQMQQRVARQAQQQAQQQSQPAQVQVQPLQSQQRPSQQMQAQNMPSRQASNSNGNRALQDYQMSLRLNEQQNKKRLLMARQEQENRTQPTDLRPNSALPPQDLSLQGQQQELYSSGTQPSLASTAPIPLTSVDSLSFSQADQPPNGQGAPTMAGAQGDRVSNKHQQSPQDQPTVPGDPDSIDDLFGDPGEPFGNFDPNGFASIPLDLGNEDEALRNFDFDKFLNGDDEKGMDWSPDISEDNPDTTLAGVLDEDDLGLDLGLDAGLHVEADENDHATSEAASHALREGIRDPSDSWTDTMNRSDAQGSSLRKQMSSRKRCASSFERHIKDGVDQTSKRMKREDEEIPIIPNVFPVKRPITVDGDVFHMESVDDLVRKWTTVEV